MKQISIIEQQIKNLQKQLNEMKEKEERKNDTKFAYVTFDRQRTHKKYRVRASGNLHICYCDTEKEAYKIAKYVSRAIEENLSLQ